MNPVLRQPSPLTVAFAAFAVACVLSAEARGDGLRPLPENDPTSAEGLPAGVAGAGIEPELGRQLPADVQLVDQDGMAVRFGDYLTDGKPTVLVFAYYACPMLCTLVLNGALQAVKALPWAVGETFRVVTVSFDPRDNPSVAAEKRSNYLKELGRPVAAKGWDFLSGTESEVRRLADAAGFHYRWDEASGQYAHAAGLFVLTPSGILSRALFGVRFDTADLRMALSEASGGKIGSLTERILLFCFHYEPKAGKYVMAAKQAMRLGGVATVLFVAALVTVLRRAETRRRMANAAAPA
jgi:protein SCO1/2